MVKPELFDEAPVFAAEEGTMTRGELVRQASPAPALKAPVLTHTTPVAKPFQGWKVVAISLLVFFIPLVATVVGLSGKFSNARASATYLSQTLAAEQQEKANLQEKVRQLEAEKSQWAREKSDLQSRVNTLQREKDDLQAAKESLEEQLNSEQVTDEEIE